MRLLALAALAALSLVLGFAGRRWFDPGVALDVTGYWAMALLALGALVAAIRWGRTNGPSLWPLLGWRGMLWTACAWGFLITREPTEFKVVMDEPMLVGASLGMHMKRSPTMPLRVYEVAGVQEYSGSFVDKRPLFFPFLLSVVHDATGYRVENAFHLNKALVLVLLILGWIVGRKLDPQIGGPLFLLWLCGWPLVAQNACGGGFEILNLVLILAVTLTATHYVEERDRTNGDFLLTSCLLLANTRYESVLYLLVFAGLWLAGAIRRRDWSITWATVVAPMLLLPLFWQRDVIASAGGRLELGLKSATQAFGVDYVSDNLLHAWRFLTAPDLDLAGSPLLGGLGLLALAGFGVLLLAWRKRNEGDLPAAMVAFGTVCAVMLVGLGVFMLYFWGQLDDPVASRLALPLIGVMGLALCAVRPVVMPSIESRRGLLVLLGLWIVVYALPVMNQHRYSQNNIHVKIFRWSHDVIAQSSAHSPLVVSVHERLWTAYRVPALSPEIARASLPQIELHRSVGTFDAVFVIQSLFDDPKTRVRIPLEGNQLPEGVTLVTVAERSFYPFNIVRISRLTAIDLDRAEASPLPPAKTCEVFRDASAEEIRQWRLLLP